MKSLKKGFLIDNKWFLIFSLQVKRSNEIGSILIRKKSYLYRELCTCGAQYKKKSSKICQYFIF